MSIGNLADANAQPTGVTTPRRPVDATMLQALTAPLPPQDLPAAELVRSMRDGNRY